VLNALSQFADSQNRYAIDMGETSRPKTPSKQDAAQRIFGDSKSSFERAQ
jgi:hypothetical protein